MLVDAADAELVAGPVWRPLRAGYSTYAATGRSTLMHRLIMGAKKGEEVDHLNGNGLDNRRANMRLATHAQNQQHQRKQRPAASSRYKGVCWDRDAGRWISYIKIAGRQVHLGRFDDEVQAAIAYDQAAALNFGAFAILNFPRRLQHARP